MGNGSTHIFDPEIAARMIHILSTRGVPFRQKEHFVYLRCPFHRGTSLGFWIHKSGAYGKCWKCSHKAGWNEWVEAAGLTRAKIAAIDNDDGESSYSLGYLKQALDGGEAEGDEVPAVALPRGMTPWVGGWRRLRPDFLRQLGVFRWFDDSEVSNYYRILFPITMENVVVGYQAGRPPQPDGFYHKRDPKYRASAHLPSKHGFFGLDQIGSNIELIILVEGLYDCTRLWQNRLPGVANIGSKSVWTDQKAEILAGLPRLKYILSAFDWDEEGHAAHDRMVESLADDDEIIIKRVRLPMKRNGTYHDIGSAPQSWISELRESARGLDWTGRWSLRPLVRTYDSGREVFDFPARVFRE